MATKVKGLRKHAKENAFTLFSDMIQLLIDLSKEIAVKHAAEAESLLQKAVDTIKQELRNSGQANDHNEDEQVELYNVKMDGTCAYDENSESARSDPHTDAMANSVNASQSSCQFEGKPSENEQVLKPVTDHVAQSIAFDAVSKPIQAVSDDSDQEQLDSTEEDVQGVDRSPDMHSDVAVRTVDNCVHLAIQQDDGTVRKIQFQVINAQYDESKLEESKSESEGRKSVASSTDGMPHSKKLETTKQTAGSPTVDSVQALSPKENECSQTSTENNQTNTKEKVIRQSGKKPLGRPRSRSKPLPMRNEDGKDVYQCKICNASLQQYHGLLVHMRSHNGERPFECKVCHKRFTTKGNMEHHVKHTHTDRDAKPFTCGECGKCFKEKKVLKVHQRIHTGERPFACPLCDQSFTQSGVLKEHLLIHTDKKPHLCHFCGHAFRSASNLKVHRLRHLNEKSHQCAVCGKAFVSSGALRKHSISHSGERRYQCEVCQKTFAYLNSLKQHRQTHHPVALQLVCESCNLTFSNMETFNEHNRLHASVKAAEVLPEQSGFEFLATPHGTVATETVYYTVDGKILEQSNKQTTHIDDETYSVHILVNEDDLENYQSVLVSAAAMDANSSLQSQTDRQMTGRPDRQLGGQTNSYLDGPNPS